MRYYFEAVMILASGLLIASVTFGAEWVYNLIKRHGELSRNVTNIQSSGDWIQHICGAFLFIPSLVIMGINITVFAVNSYNCPDTLMNYDWTFCAFTERQLDFKVENY